MKQTISWILLQHALDYLERARLAAKEEQPLDEISACIGAHLMTAIAIEGVANEVAASVFSGALLDHFDRVDTVMKWYILSGSGDHMPFEFGQEPLQTVRTLMAMRNRIAHPKMEKLGEEIMIRKSSGKLLRNVGLNHPVDPGDNIIVGADEHLKIFNYADTSLRVRKGVLAIDQLRQHLSITGMGWAKEVLAELS